MSMDPLLNVEHLKTYFWIHQRAVVRANDNISFKVSEKEVVCIVGESGCGKSTTALSVLGLIRPPGRMVQGRVLFKGVELQKLSEDEMRKIRGKEISMVFQNPSTYLNPVMKVGDQIAENVVFHLHLGWKEAREKAIEALRQVKIPSPERISQSYPHELSGGMKQRTLIAMAIVCHPSLVILDEPTTALDVTIQSQILQLIKDLRNRVGISMMLITHDLGIVADIADRVYIMYAGQIMEHCDVFNIFKEPLHPYTQALLASVLSINEYRENLVSIQGTVPDLKNPPAGCRFHPRCQKGMEVCTREEPLLREVKGGHFAACWLYC
jgi:peptide/nickel transport system ATP-binding protein